MRSLFEPIASSSQKATAEEGYWSMAVGVCAEQSKREGRAVDVPGL